jgi:O-antigen/teichoic acid export membrane protein
MAAPPAGDAELAEGIYRRAWRRCAVMTPALALVALAVIAAVDGPEVGPLAMTVASVVPIGFFFLALGRLQGWERFTAFSLCFGTWGAARPFVFLPLVAAGLGVYAAVGATAAAVVIALAAALSLMRGDRPAREPSAAEWRAFTRPLVPLIVGLCGLGLLTQLDVIVAKLALSDDTAGQFAATATLAKAVYLVPQAVSLVLLPRAAARSAATEDTGELLAFGVGVTFVAGGVASLFLWLMAEPLLRITFGADFTGSAWLLGAYAAASTLVGALIVVINHHVGRGADRFVWGMAGIAALQTVLFLALHGSQEQIVAADAIVGLAGLLLHESMYFRTREAIVPGLVRAVGRAREERNARRSAARSA